MVTPAGNEILRGAKLKSDPSVAACVKIWYTFHIPQCIAILYIPVAGVCWSNISTPIIRSVDDGLVRTRASCTDPLSSITLYVDCSKLMLLAA